MTGKVKKAQYTAFSKYECSGIGNASGKNIAAPKLTNVQENFVRV
jgi:hypothetical protein